MGTFNDPCYWQWQYSGSGWHGKVVLLLLMHYALLIIIVLSFGSFACQGYAWSSGRKFVVRSFVFGAPSPT